MLYFYFSILLITGLFAFDPDHWHNQIMLGQMGVSIWLSIEIYRRIHLIPAIIFGFFSIYAMYCIFAIYFMGIKGLNIQVGMDAATARSCLFLFCASLPFIFCSKKELEKWLYAFQIFALVNCVYMIFSYFFRLEPNGWVGATGMIGMDSVDGTFLSLILPTFIFSKQITDIDKKISLSLITIALLLTKSSTVYGVLCLELMVYIFYVINKTAKNVGLLILGGTLSWPIGWLLLRSELFDGNGRLGILKLTYRFFINIIKNQTDFISKALHIILGLGSGSFLILLPIAQGDTKSMFIWLHNEPFQVLFEQGFLGFILLSILFVTMLYKNRNKPSMMMILLGMGLQSFIQPSFRYFLFALFLMFLVRLSFEEEPLI